MHVHLILSLVYFPHAFLTYILCYGYIYEMCTEGFILLNTFLNPLQLLSFISRKKKVGGGDKLLIKIKVYELI